MQQIFNTGILSTNHFDDFDQMADAAASRWGQRYRKLRGSRESGFARQLNLPSVQVTHIGWRPGIRIETGTPSGSIGFVLQTAGDGRMRENGKTVAADEILIMHSPRDYDLVNPPDTEYLVLAIEKDRVLRHLESLCGERSRQFNEASRLISCANYQRSDIARAFQSYLNLAYEDSGVLASAEQQDAMVDELLDVLLISNAATKTDKRLVQRHQLAERAAAYIRDNMDSHVTLRAMCDHVGVSERSLRQGFIERFGLSPKAYLKHHRLYRLRQLLRGAATGEITVTRAALLSGLTHLGRLSCEYRALFGESPSQTLAQAPEHELSAPAIAMRGKRPSPVQSRASLPISDSLLASGGVASSNATGVL